MNTIFLSINLYSSLISGLFMIVLGIFVFWKNPRAKLNIIFLFFCAAMANWLLSSYMMFGSGSDQAIVFWDRIVYAGVVFIPVLMYHFGLIFTGRERKNIAKLLIGYFFSFVFLLISRTDYFVAGLYKYYWGFHTKAQIFHHLFLFFYFVYIVLFLLEIYSFLKKSNRQNVLADAVSVNPVKYLFVAFIILNLGAYAFLPAYGLNINPIGAYWAEIASVVILAFAITKYKLFSIKVILTDLLVGIIGIILFLLPFFMPSFELKLLTVVVLILFSIFGFYLIKATEQENRRREEAELVAAKERELRRNAEELAANLKHLDEAKTQFLLSTQHHLRSPLAVIQGYLSMVAEGNYGRLPAKAKEKINASFDATQKLINLVNELLDVAHFQMNKGAAATQPTDMMVLVGGVVNDLGKSAQAKKIYLRFEKPALPTPPINVDPNGIREAIYNIVDNAVKYTQKGGVVVSMAVVTGKLNVSVADTGIGMDERDKRDLFRRTFERGEKAKQVDATGKGIGLYLAAQMIVGNGGIIRVESEGRGKGTTFIVELPMGARKVADDAAPRVAAQKT